MTSAAKQILDLAPEDSAFVEAKIRAGAYHSAGEVLGAGLRALREQDEAIEDWLRDEVVPVYDAMQADPSRGAPVDLAFDAVRTR